MHLRVLFSTIISVSFAMDLHHGRECCDEFNYNPNWCSPELGAKKVVQLTKQYQSLLIVGDYDGILEMSLPNASSLEIAAYCLNSNCCRIENTLSAFLKNYNGYTISTAGQEPECAVTHLPDGRIVTAYAEWNYLTSDPVEWYVYRTEIAWKRVWGCLYKIEQVKLVDFRCQTATENLLQDCSLCD